MMFLNLGLLGLLLQLLGVNVFLRDELPKRELVIIMISLFVLNYFLFVHKGNFRSIEKELKKESPEKRWANTILIWLYVILSFVLFVFSAIFIKKFN